MGDEALKRVAAYGMNCGLTHREWSVLLAILPWLDWDDDLITITVKEIMEQSGIGRTNVEIAIRMLKEKGIITYLKDCSATMLIDIDKIIKLCRKEDRE